MKEPKETPKMAAQPPVPVMGANAVAVEPYVHAESRRTVALHDGGNAFTATGIYAGAAAAVAQPLNSEPAKK